MEAGAAAAAGERDVHGADGRGVGQGDDAREQVRAAQRERERTRGDGGGQRRGEGVVRDRGRREPLAREEQAQRGGDRSAAFDAQALRHPFIAASMSSARFGVSMVRISQPPSVTSASSSMRMPMSWNAIGTSSAART